MMLAYNVVCGGSTLQKVKETEFKGLNAFQVSHWIFHYFKIFFCVKLESTQMFGKSGVYRLTYRKSYSLFKGTSKSSFCKVGRNWG